MSSNIDRIMAQKDMRSLKVAAYAQSDQSGEAATYFRQRLVIETGDIVKTVETHERDEEGFRQLKEMAQSN